MTAAKREGGHTAGPWAVGFSDGSGETYITADDGKVVVVSGGKDDWGLRHGVRNPANARLIAAAPVLLEALLRCKFDSLNMSLADIEFCRTAIAQATGAGHE